MQGAILYGPRDVRFEECPEPTIVEPDRRDHPAVGDVHLRI